MTNELFWNLYNSGNLSVKVYKGVEENGTEKTIEAFEYDGKFFLRIITELHYVTGERRFGKRYRMNRSNCFFKEFETKEHANNYFRKAGQGLKRVEIA